jgi:DtxR family Mn-dependent transcriptional regulator
MIRKKKGEKERIRQTAEDLLKGVAHRDQLEEIWTAEGLLRRENPLMEQALALEYLQREGLATRAGSAWRLTAKGRARALELLRAHRLVETYLARNEGLPAEALHAAAEEAEHRFTTDGINQLADLMNRPRFDPHGDPIPERSQDLRRINQVPLLEMEPDQVGRIAHIEDEPRVEFETLLEMGLAPELPVRILQRTADTMTIGIAGEELVLPARLAAHVEIIPVEDPDWYPEHLERLSSLGPGERGAVEFISPSCMGPERRRLLDFGMVPGSVVRCEFASPFGSPVAYSVRGTTLGLRTTQARNIFIRRIHE